MESVTLVKMLNFTDESLKISKKVLLKNWPDIQFQRHPLIQPLTPPPSPHTLTLTHVYGRVYFNQARFAFFQSLV